MKNKILIVFVLGIFLISLASASLLGTYKQWECLNLIQTCDDCTYNNITNVLYPNSSVAVANVSMTMEDTFYNYEFCGTSATGVYLVNGFGDEGGVKTTWYYDFEITPSGEIGKSFLQNPVLLILIGLGLIFIVLGMSLKAPPLGFMGSILFVLGGMYATIYGFGDVSNLYTTGGGIVILGLGVIFMISSGYDWATRSND